MGFEGECQSSMRAQFDDHSLIDKTFSYIRYVWVMVSRFGGRELGKKWLGVDCRGGIAARMASQEAGSGLAS